MESSNLQVIFILVLNNNFRETYFKIFGNERLLLTKDNNVKVKGNLS